LRALAGDKRTRWRVTAEDWRRHKRYDAIRAAAQEIGRETSTGDAPWIVIDGTDANYRSATVGRILLEAMRKRLDASVSRERRVTAAPIVPQVDNLGLLRSLDLSQRLGKKAHAKQIEKRQGELNQLTRHKRFRDRSLVFVFEGMDAAGKGGAIRRVTAALDARRYHIVPIAAPTDEERAHPYLWRFWRHIPRRGRITIFDRSWYGRVLVERVEGYCSEADWMRAYAEINQFEEELARAGAIVVKFWLHISQQEQLARFRAREKTVFKRFKITPDDWRNRKKWPRYEQAVCDMIDRTSSTFAPWTLVEAEDKDFARIKVLRTIVERLEREL
jgi:polyphosphate:AMP phosphotransferase